MFNVSDLFVRTALAADQAAGAEGGATGGGVTLVGEPSAWMKFMPLFLIFVVFYVLLIRPQQKQLEKQAALLKAIKKGDKIVTAGGVVGVVSKVEGEKYLVVEIAKDVQIKVVRSTVTGLAEDAKENETQKG